VRTLLARWRRRALGSALLLACYADALCHARHHPDAFSIRHHAERTAVAAMRAAFPEVRENQQMRDGSPRGAPYV